MEAHNSQTLSMETHVWQALPQRKRKMQDVAPSLIPEADAAISSSKEPIIGCGIVERSVQHQQRITDNVKARSALQRANATLESQDGCAGEFFEYLDHTADVQFHCWGKTLTEAFANMAPCMFNYITDLVTVVIDPAKTIEFTVKGHDLQSLLYKYMEEFLFYFSTDGFCCVRAEIIKFDLEDFEILVKAHGDTFDQTVHPQGTEIKAITYSNMQIHNKPDRADLYVIVDI